MALITAPLNAEVILVVRCSCSYNLSLPTPLGISVPSSTSSVTTRSLTRSTNKTKLQLPSACNYGEVKLAHR